MKCVLIVEDDHSFRLGLAQYLKEKGYNITEAENGKVARDLIGLREFDLIISDVQMPFLDGIELLKWIRANRQIPVILMTGFTNLLDAKEAAALGAVKFLTKPFKNDQLLIAIRETFRPTREEPSVDESGDSGFCRVSIDEFVSKNKIEFDVFVRLSPGKFVKIGIAGSEFPIERIRAYKEKDVQHLHIRREDFSKLVDFNLALSKVVAKSSSVGSEKKLNFMKYTGEVILEKAFVEGVSRETFDDAKDLLVTTVNVITESPEHFALLDVLNTHADWVYAHCVGASMYALMIARLLKHSSSQVFFKLGMAGLFHEIGFKEIPREVFEKPRPLMTQTERATLETHVTRSRDILAAMNSVPNDVIDIVYQQHEDILGQGYPRRLTRERIHPLAKIFQVADVFADTAIHSPLHPGMPGPHAIAQMEKFHADKFDKDAFGALKNLFSQRC